VVGSTFPLLKKVEQNHTMMIWLNLSTFEKVEQNL